MENRNPEHNNATFNNPAWQQSWHDGMMHSNMAHFDGSVPSLSSSLTSPSSSGGGGPPSSWHNSGLSSLESPNGQQRFEGLPPTPLTDGLYPDEPFRQGMSAATARRGGIDHNGVFNEHSPRASLTPTARRRREPSLTYGSSLPVHHEEGGVDHQDHQDSSYMSAWYEPTPLSPNFTHRSHENNSFSQQQERGVEGLPRLSVEPSPIGDDGSRVHLEPRVYQHNQNAWEHILGTTRGQMATTQYQNANQDPVDTAGGDQAPSQFHINSPQYAQHSMGSLQQHQENPLTPQQGFIPHLPNNTDRLNESTHSHSRSTHSHSSSVARRFGNFNINDGQSLSHTGSTSYSTIHTGDDTSFARLLPFRDVVASPSRRLSRSEQSSVSQLNDSFDSLDVLDVLDNTQEDPQGLPEPGPVLRHGSAASNNAMIPAAAAPPPQFEQRVPGQQILQLNDQDILGGQGSGSAMRASNQRYLQRVRSLRHAYQALNARDINGKNAIVMQVYNFVHEQGGRFVKKLRPTDSFVVELPMEEAMEKIKRALRQKEDDP